MALPVADHNQPREQNSHKSQWKYYEGLLEQQIFQCRAVETRLKTLDSRAFNIEQCGISDAHTSVG